jgi:hypothetical protein
MNKQPKNLSDAKSQANKYGFYGQFVAALKSVDTSDMEQVLKAFETAKEEKSKFKAELRANEDAKAQRESERVQFYQKNGYWKDSGNDPETANALNGMALEDGVK